MKVGRYKTGLVLVESKAALTPRLKRKINFPAKEASKIKQFYKQKHVETGQPRETNSFKYQGENHFKDLTKNLHRTSLFWKREISDLGLRIQKRSGDNYTFL